MNLTRDNSTSEKMGPPRVMRKGGGFMTQDRLGGIPRPEQGGTRGQNRESNGPVFYGKHLHI